MTTVPRSLLLLGLGFAVFQLCSCIDRKVNSEMAGYSDLRTVLGELQVSALTENFPNAESMLIAFDRVLDKTNRPIAATASTIDFIWVNDNRLDWLSSLTNGCTNIA